MATVVILADGGGPYTGVEGTPVDFDGTGSDAPGGATFDYVLESSPACVKPVAMFSNNVLSVRLPEKDVIEWAGTEAVSISAEQLLDEGGQLNILVEKDFACLAPREGEDESDMYPHPEEGTNTC